MRSLINFFVYRPVTVIMILSATIIAAIFCLFKLPVNSLPEIIVPKVAVETIYPGMTANEVRSLVTIPLEDGLSPIKGLEKIRSVSRDNRSIINMEFRWGTDPMTAAMFVREAIDTVYPSLPEGVQKPAVTSGDSDATTGAYGPHAIITVASNSDDLLFARKLAEYEMRARLRRIDGVGSVVIVGGKNEEHNLILDVPRLAAIGISPSEFAGILAQETADIPAGNAKEGNKELVIVSSGRPNSVYDLSKIILPVTGSSLTVGDSGILKSSAERQKSVFVCDGINSVALEIYRRQGADPLKLSRDLKKLINETSQTFSRDAQIKIVYDSTPDIVSGIKGFLFSAILAVTAVVAVLFFFIRSLKYSLLASLSIPFSAAAGICILYIFNKSINSMSLGGLAMGIGLVSDISVVVLHIIHRVSDPKEIVKKVSLISGSSAASTLTTAIVFLPILFLPGMLGSLFGEIAIALVTSVAAGWFYAQFCLPSLFSYLKKPIKNAEENVFINCSFNKEYAKKLLFFIRRPRLVFPALAIMILTGTLCLFVRPMVFVNPDEAKEIHISLTFPPGTILEEIEGIGKDVSEKISELKFVNTVFGRAGAEEEDTGSRANIEFINEELILRCILEKGIKPKKALAELNKYINFMFGDLPYAVYLPKDRTEVLLGLSNQNTYVINAKNRDELEEKIENFNQLIADSNIEVIYKPQGNRPELRLYPDREALAFLSIPAAQIAETLYVINEGVVATKLEIEGQSLNVRVTGNLMPYSTVHRNDEPVQYLEKTPIKTSKGKTVYLGSLGKIERKETEAALARLERSDALYADILSLENIPEEIKMFAARADESIFARYKKSLVLFVIMVLILLYMTMGAQFESFLLPLILMLSIPFSLAGAGPALLISGSKIDSGAVLGLIALFGLVVNNSLLLFEVSCEKIKKGLSAGAAVFQGAVERLQAIMITAATTALALCPLIISPMTNSQRSLAAAMLGGVLASALLCLFAIPPILIKFFIWRKKYDNVA